LRELRLPPLQGPAVRRHRRQRPVEVRARAQLVTEDVPEEDGGLEHELCNDGGLEGSQSSVRRDLLVGEGQLGQTVVTARGAVQFSPGVGRELAPAQREEKCIEHFAFVFEAFIQRGEYGCEAEGRAVPRFGHAGGALRAMRRASDEGNKVRAVSSSLPLRRCVTYSTGVQYVCVSDSVR